MKLGAKILLAIGVIILIMLVFPLIVVNFGDEVEIIICIFILVWAINPLAAIGLGILAGTDIKKSWWIIVLFAVAFPLLYWISLKEFIIEVYIYSVGYFILGAIAMLITALIKKKSVTD